MIKNYFKIALRSFGRHKLFTFINVVGLSIGISAAVVIYLIAHYDFTFDKFHKDSDRIYRVVSEFTFQGQKSYSSGVTTPLAAAVKSQVTGIENVVQLFTLTPDVLIPKNGAVPVKFKLQDRIALTDGQYFKMFEYSWLAGSPKNALQEPGKVVLTESRAKLYFPGLNNHQIIGKTVTYDTLRTTVTGIVGDITQNTDLAFHDFISLSTAAPKTKLADDMQITQWNSVNSASEVFIKLMPDTRVDKIAGSIKNVVYQHRDRSEKNFSSTIDLQPLADIHFNQQYGTFDFSSVANKTTLYGLLAIGTFLLLLGCINFINLTTAQAAQRAKEIGIRKTMGSNRKQLIFQFLSETFLITFFAVIISACIAPVILKLFADFVSPNIKVNLITHPDILIFLVALTVMVSLLAGFYPAFMLSGYKPVAVLKNQAQSNSSKTRNAWLRKSLTVFQFVIAQFFIIATIMVSKQIYYALHKDLGFKKDAIIIVKTPYKTRKLLLNKLLLNKFTNIPQVEMVSLGMAAPSSDQINQTISNFKDGKKEIKTEVEEKFVDENYIPLYKIKLLAGRNIQVTDTTHGLIINENYAKTLGFKYPRQAIDQLLYFDFKGNKKPLSIIGVTADFHTRSLTAPVKPLLILYGADTYQQSTFNIALKPETPGGYEWKQAIAAVQKEWKQIYPDDDFTYDFYDKSIAKFYDGEQHTAQLLTWATGLCIFISCLGLMGLAIYTTNQRTKEIGVRKVLGASVARIVRLLSVELVWLIVLAGVIVTPIAWYALNKWIQNYADRTTISWWIFAVSGMGMLLAALLTSSFQTVKAATANPVKSLRSE